MIEQLEQKTVIKSNKKENKKNKEKKEFFLFTIFTIYYLQFVFVRSADLFAGFSEPAFTLLIVVDGFVKFRFTEVRPVGVAEIKFRVSTLPEQVVAQADFSARTYQ